MWLSRVRQAVKQMTAGRGNRVQYSEALSLDPVCDSVYIYTCMYMFVCVFIPSKSENPEGRPGISDVISPDVWTLTLGAFDPTVLYLLSCSSA